MEEPQAEGEVFIIAGQKPIIINDLISLVAEELNKGIPKLRIPVRLAKLSGLFIEKLYGLLPFIFSGEPFITRDKVDILTIDRSYSIDKAIKLLGYHPKVDYNEGVKLTANWLRDNNIISKPA